MKATNRFPRTPLAGCAVVALAIAFMFGCSGKDDPVPPLPPGPVQITPISYLKEMDGNTPAHEGEVFTVEGVATMGTGVMVAGGFLKFHIQDGTGGAYVFADTQAQTLAAARQFTAGSFEGIEIYEGDRVRITGAVGSHKGMIEFYPLSASAISVLESGQDLPDVHVIESVNAVYEDPEPYRYVGDLVRVNGVAIQGDAPQVWPEYGQHTKLSTQDVNWGKGIELQTPGDTRTLYAQFYPGSGIPGSNPPEGFFDIVGVLHREVVTGGEVSYTLYPRALYDINPADAPLLTGYSLKVYKHNADPESAPDILVDGLPQCAYDTGRAGGPGAEPVVTLASFITREVVTDPKNWVYKLLAWDGRQPFDTLEFNQMKSGLLYESEGERDGEVQGVLNSHFHDGMGLSDIFRLKDLAGIILYPLGEGPDPGEGIHGEGVNLVIDASTYAVNFADLPDPDPTRGETETQRLLARFVPDSIIASYTRRGFFSHDQIRVLYDYRLVPYGGGGGCFPVTWDAINAAAGAPMVSLSDQAPFATVSGLAGCGPIDDLFTIEMARKVIVDDGAEERVFYWNNPQLRRGTIGGGEEVIFLDSLLDLAGLDEMEKYENDYNLVASDGFETYFPYGHHHLEDMYFRPLVNETFVTDDNPVMTEYRRYSVKGLLKVELRPVEKSDPPSIYVDDGLGFGWVSNPNSGDTCYGCHFRSEQLLLPVNCAQCHAMP